MSGSRSVSRTYEGIVDFDVLDQAATATLTAQWSVDYPHLGKYDGRWTIIDVLWQSPPR